MKKLALFLIFASAAFNVGAKEFHVSANDGKDTNNGSASAPFRTINAAARIAGPGDTVSVHEGTYREWVNPLRGGSGEHARILYRAYPGEKAVIKGSETVTGWKKEKSGIWKVSIPNSFFGDHNPYKELIFGDWYNNHGWKQHTGEVFLNGKSLYETDSLHKVVEAAPRNNIRDKEGSTYKWYCESDDENTYIWANFHEYNPNRELVEITTRPTCFYPTRQGINYITLRGFEICQAATQWGAPTAGQVGMVATHWNKGWIIEDNMIHDSKCSGITLGKEHGTGHDVWSHDRAKDGSLHYIETTFRVLRNGWNKANIGSHIVRDNEIYNCEQTGICGSMGCAFSVIEYNYIHDIYTKRQFSGAEIAGIKFHAAIDTRISNNCIHTTGRAIWLDWMTQGTRVSSNLLYDNDWEDLFVEVNHGPFVVDNNIMLSPRSIRNQSESGAYVHNIFSGDIVVMQDRNRFTPYHLAHSTEVMGLAMIFAGDDRYYNNIFIAQPGKPEQVLSQYDKAVFPIFAGGNLYTKGTKKYKEEKSLETASDYSLNLIEDNGVKYLEITFDNSPDETPTVPVNTGMLGLGKITGLPFDNPDGTLLAIDHDYSGRVRSTDKPTPGPFENPGTSRVKLEVWKWDK